MLAELGSAAIGALGGISANKSSAKFAKEAYQHRYQWMVNDLRKAGLNPMLAVSNSPGSVAQPNFENVGEAAIKGAGAASSARAAREQSTLLKEQQNVARATANNTMAQTQAIEIDNLLKRVKPDYQDALKMVGEKGEITGTSAAASARWDADLEHTRNAAKSLGENAKLSQLDQALRQGDISKQQIELKYADELAQIETAYRAAMQKAADAKIPQAQADAQFWENAGPWAKWASFLKTIIGK